MKNIKFTVGGFLVHDQLIIDMVKKFQDELDITLPIKNVFGSVNSRLNYGRPDINMKISIPDIKKSIKNYNDLGIGINLTFSRYDVTDEDLKDYNSNLLFDLIAENDINGLIISDQKVYDHFKSKKPNITTTFSYVGTHHLLNGKERQKIYPTKEEQYDYIVPNANENFDIEFLENIKNKNKYELLINQLCIKNCMLEYEHNKIHFKKHMDDIMNLENLTNIREFRKFKCPVRPTGDFIFDKNVEYVYHTKEHFQKLQDMGFNNFKLKGREDIHNQILYDICNFIVPEKYAKKAFDTFCK